MIRAHACIQKPKLVSYGRKAWSLNLFVKYCFVSYCIVEKFGLVQFFFIFRMMPRHTKIITANFCIWNFNHVKFETGNLPRGNVARVMVLYRYFQPSDALSDPSGTLFAHISPAAIKDGNKFLRNKGCGIISTYEHTKIRIQKSILKPAAICTKSFTFQNNNTRINSCSRPDCLLIPAVRF